MNNHLLKKSLYFALAASTLAFGGCRKRGGTAASSPGTTDPNASSSSAPAAPKGEFTPAPAVPADSPAAKAHSEMDQKLASGNVQLQLQVLDELVQAWVMSQNAIPKNLEALVQAKMLATLPSPPAGKRVAVDQKTGRAVLVNQ